jgi:Flp pilus assembly protein TadD
MAIEALSNSTLKAPDNPSYNYHLALAYHQSGNNAEARKFLEKALNGTGKFDQADAARKLLESIKG